MLSCENKIKKVNLLRRRWLWERRRNAIFENYYLRVVDLREGTTRQTAILSVDFTLESISAHQESLIQFTKTWRTKVVSRFLGKFGYLCIPRRIRRRRNWTTFFGSFFMCFLVCSGRRILMWIVHVNDKLRSFPWGWCDVCYCVATQLTGLKIEIWEDFKCETNRKNAILLYDCVAIVAQPQVHTSATLIVYFFFR